MSHHRLSVLARYWHHLPEAERTGFIAGARYFLPSTLAVFSWGLVTGIAMSQSILTTSQAIGMSLLVYAGSAQLATLPLFAAHLPIWTILLTAAVVNLRFVIFSAGLLPHFAHLPLWRRLLLGSFNGDLNFAYFCQRYPDTHPQPGKEGFFWGMAITNFIIWQGSSISGILLANLFPSSWGLGLAGTLALIPLLISSTSSRSALIAVIVSASVALLMLDLPYRLGLVVAIIAAISAAMMHDEIVVQLFLKRTKKNTDRP